jgi:predicted TIM-barrel fold metal-dependent hydrolase
MESEGMSSVGTVESPAAVPQPLKSGYVDTDVHHGCREKGDIAPYMPKHYRDRFDEYGFGGGGGAYVNNGGIKGYRVDALEDGVPNVPGVAAPSVELTRSQLLDDCGVDIALLTGGPVLGASSLPDVDYAAALCQAFNDFTIEHWLAADDRFRAAISVGTQEPEKAAAEIDRVGDHPQVAAVVFPGGAPRAYGQRFYRPIYEACLRHDLAVVIHFGGEGGGVNPSPTAAGFPTYYAEARQSRPAFYQAHLASYVFEGIFERYPELRIGILEGGFAWVPAFLWRMDADWKGLRTQTPWVKRPPSEYIFENVRFSSQPADEPEPPEALHHVLEWMKAERTLMFSSDYPHWDWDDPNQTFTRVDETLRGRIMSDNAREMLRI